MLILYSHMQQEHMSIESLEVRRVWFSLSHGEMHMYIFLLLILTLLADSISSEGSASMAMMSWSLCTFSVEYLRKQNGHLSMDASSSPLYFVATVEAWETKINHSLIVIAPSSTSLTFRCRRLRFPNNKSPYTQLRGFCKLCTSWNLPNFEMMNRLYAKFGLTSLPKLVYMCHSYGQL